MKYLTVSL